MGFLILRDLGSIKEKLLDLFSGGSKNQRRIIFSTYLDIKASQFFPDIRGVEIYCCPQVGNIDPYALEHLHQQGAIIYFVDGLHMNFYWVENKGAIIGSASLCLSRIENDSDNFQEMVVFLFDSSAIDIVSIISSLNKKPLSDRILNDLKEKHHVYWRTYEGLGVYAEIKLPEIHIYNGIQSKENQKILCYNCFKMKKIIQESVMEKS